MLGILEKISPSELVFNGYISNHNKLRRPRPKFKVSFYLYFCCFWINVTQINFKNIKRKIQRIISDSCFRLKSWFNVDARAPSIPLLNFPFKVAGCLYSTVYHYAYELWRLSITVQCHDVIDVRVCCVVLCCVGNKRKLFDFFLRISQL